MRRPVFLDRDGVLNVDVTPYVCRFEDFRVFPYTFESLERLYRHGFDLYIVSNQQGLGLGLIEPGTLEKVNDYLSSECTRRGFSLGGIYYCTALKGANDPWRKPSPGMIFAAQDEHNLSLAGATMVGDKWSDIECGYRAGLKTILVYSGVTAPGEAEQWNIRPDHECANLSEAVDLIIAQGLE